jgi:hypothetical protein
MLATLVLALSAAPALADTSQYHLHTQMMTGSQTSSRQGGGCSVSSSHGALTVGCRGRETATLVYTYSTGRHPVHGTPMGWTYASRSFGTDVDVSAKAGANGTTIRVTVTVAGGTATIGSVCVGYYAR